MCDPAGQIKGNVSIKLNNVKNYNPLNRKP